MSGLIVRRVIQTVTSCSISVPGSCGPLEALGGRSISYRIIRVVNVCRQISLGVNGGVIPGGLICHIVVRGLIFGGTMLVVIRGDTIVRIVLGYKGKRTKVER